MILKSIFIKFLTWEQNRDTSIKDPLDIVGQLWDNAFNMQKNKDINFRLTGIDFEFLRKQAEKEEVTISEILRRYIAYHKKVARKEQHG